MSCLREVEYLIDICLLASSALPSSANGGASNATTACNGSPLFCSLPFTHFTFPGTHNSGAFNLTTSGYLQHGLLTDTLLHNATKRNNLAECMFCNQRYPISGQLERGIRSLDIDYCYVNGSFWNCHAPNDHFETVMGMGPEFIASLVAVKQFLESHPQEVVVIRLADAWSFVKDVSIDDVRQLVLHDVASVFCETNDSGVQSCPLLYGRPVRSGPAALKSLSMAANASFAGDGDVSVETEMQWPTLGNMVSQNQRLVIFQEATFDRNLPSWIHSVSEVTQ
jgi:hypothetical protein